MSFFENPALLSDSNSYFAAMNTHRGFVSLFPELFSGYEKRVIKGGPGTGKSSFMKKIAERACSLGLKCEKYYCSSDTNSLDAVVIPELKTVILDGTAPHMTDPEYPGVSDSIINLGEYWNTEKLRAGKESVISLTDDIGKEYKRVYSLLSAAKKAEEAYDAHIFGEFDFETAQALADRIIKKHRPEKGSGKITPRQVCAFGVHGAVYFDSLFSSSETIYLLRDRLSASHLFFDILCDKLTACGADIEVSRTPIDEKICSIRIPSCSLLISLPFGADINGKIINTEKLMNEGTDLKKTKSALKALSDIGKKAEKEASHILASIGEMHDELEKYYIDAMDFEAVNNCADRISAELFG